MEPETQAETEVVVPAATEAEPSQDPVAEELARVEQKETGRTKREKLEYTKRRVESQIAELDAEGGTTTEVSIDKSAPMTVAMYENLEREKASKTALQMADEIGDQNERNLTKYHIEHTIRSSGNPAEDLRLARAIVNSVKNGMIVEEVSRGTPPQRAGSAPGAPAKLTPKEPEITPDELYYMKPPFNLSKEQIIASRPK